MLQSVLASNAPAHARALGPVDRIELALAQVVNATRRLARRADGAAQTALDLELARFVRQQTCELPQHWLRPALVLPRHIELWRDTLLDCRIVLVVWAPGVCSPVHDACVQAGATAVWSGALQRTTFRIHEATREAVRLRLVRDVRLHAGSVLEPDAARTITLYRNPSTTTPAISLQVETDPRQHLTTYSRVDPDWYRLGQQAQVVESS